MEANGILPDAPQAGNAVEWGFLLDVNKDGTPDWGVFAALDVNNGWQQGISNQTNNEKLVGAQFPGTFTHIGSTLTWTVDAASIGSPQDMKWFAFANFFVKGADGNVQKATDQQPEISSNTESGSWLPYP